MRPSDPNVTETRDPNASRATLLTIVGPKPRQPTRVPRDERPSPPPVGDDRPGTTVEPPTVVLAPTDLGELPLAPTGVKNLALGVPIGSEDPVSF